MNILLCVMGAISQIFLSRKARDKIESFFMYIRMRIVYNYIVS